MSTLHADFRKKEEEEEADSRSVSEYDSDDSESYISETGNTSNTDEASSIEQSEADNKQERKAYKKKEPKNKVRIIEKVVEVRHNNDNDDDDDNNSNDRTAPFYEDYMSPTPSPKSNTASGQKSDQPSKLQIQEALAILRKIDEKRGHETTEKSVDQEAKETSGSAGKKTKAGKGQKVAKAKNDDKKTTREIIASHAKYRRTLDNLQKSIDTIGKKVTEARSIFEH